MKIAFLILIIANFFSAESLYAHKAHFEKSNNVSSNTEILTASNEPMPNAGVCTPDIPDNEDECCCSNEFCSGPGNNEQNMTCKNHCEDLSKDINLTNQNKKNQSTYILFSRVNVLFIEKDNRNIKCSQKAIFLSTPTYISIQSFLI